MFKIFKRLTALEAVLDAVIVLLEKKKTMTREEIQLEILAQSEDEDGN